MPAQPKEAGFAAQYLRAFTLVSPLHSFSCVGLFSPGLSAGGQRRLIMGSQGVKSLLPK